MSADVTIAILAGGRSRRMGSDKSFTLLQGKPVIEHVVARLGRLGLPMLLVANRPAEYDSLGQPVHPDVVPGKGSLGGIYSAVYHSGTPYTLCVACDMPFLNDRLLAYLLSLRTGYDIVVPRVGGKLETLHALYSQACLPPMHANMAADRLRIIDFYDAVRVRYVDEETVRRFDPELRSFFNVNTPEDLSVAEGLMGELE